MRCRQLGISAGRPLHAAGVHDREDEDPVRLLLIEDDVAAVFVAPQTCADVGGKTAYPGHLGEELEAGAQV